MPGTEEQESLCSSGGTKASHEASRQLVELKKKKKDGVLPAPPPGLADLQNTLLQDAAGTKS